MSGATWATMSKRAKLDLLVENVAEEHRADVREALSKWFLTHSMADVNYCMNVVLREAWRASHGGDTKQWDAAAAAAGTVLE